MNAFESKVAVITGAASGIGRGLADRCVQEGMRIVLADIEEKALSSAESEFKAAGAQVLGVPTDISKVADVKFLAQKTINSFGKIDLLFNNAGVATGSSLWESTINDCKWVIDVNLWGTIYCIREFVPIMLEQNTTCHIINTSSIAGLATFHPSALYHLTKHGIVAISEQLYHDLKIRNAKIKVAVLCPAFVNTNIMDAARNRPAAYLDPPSQMPQFPELENAEEDFQKMIQNGMSPSKVADIVFRAISDERFYILTHPEMNSLIKERMEGILQNRHPMLSPVDGPQMDGN